MTSGGGFLLSYFLSEEVSDGEQVRFALSDGPEPLAWTPLNAGLPVLPSAVGEGGTRDPFLVRYERGNRFVLLATDLKIGTGQDWDRATRHGSDSIIVWESADLVTWQGPFRRCVSTPDAGNTWAPKAFWSHERKAWLVFWASALFAPGSGREAGSHQRMMVAETTDFRTFGDPEVYLDLGHDVIDATFLVEQGRHYRFSANAMGPEGSATAGRHIFGEVGTSLDDPAFTPLSVDIGKGVMVQAEGPAVAADPAGGRWYLLADEFGLRGYQLFATSDLAGGVWEHLPDAALPPGARHGSLLAVSAQEMARLRSAQW
ncbi:glycoside hydrolase family 43 protein [Arthrobacter glacialis]|uniref:1,4-beta-xylanase n=1 Tax=Arthrobacter glacialis TaxID=1664 RepID=A0A2S4A122_ARTGL|nr:glycoside hydrolase family 43 protein [Arthrobacter glacialis]POH75215.1 1,4-beta-xylanase [Arthrobacter glacialis]